MTIKEIINKIQNQKCLCPLCAAIGELTDRITYAKRHNSELENIPTWQDGIKKLKALKLKGIEAVMSTMPDKTNERQGRDCN